MTVRDIFSFLDGLYPVKDAADYDNVGILIGDEEAIVSKAVISLDCTFSTLKKAEETGAELIITHHPVIFEPLKTVKKGTVVYEAVQKGISVISMHTNIDTSDGGLNDLLAEKIGLVNIRKEICPDGFTFRKGELSEEMPAEEFAKLVSKRINKRIKYSGRGNVKTVAVCSGSGGSLSELAFSDCNAFLTADVKHSAFMLADSLDKVLLDAGHFETEDIIVDELCRKLSDKITVIPHHAEIIKYI